MGNAIVKQGKLVFLKTYLAYIPTLIHFLICTVLGSLFISGSPANYLTYVSLSHYSAMPATMLATFVQSTIPATKSLVGRVSRQGSTSSRAGKRSKESTNSGKNAKTLVAAPTTTSGVGRGSLANESDRQLSTISTSPSDHGSLSSRASIMNKK
ncbi:hypothetical protein BCR44DRAFT_258218 [Catenaria anguillulae PL171]|uniref:Uncharacterized protein n=1 Tax=Catenaria anguillulae PL171 TaxID=765915 RepID=A0A1Y2HKQ3_9FUNG|nr:hypothetical protein BCR44DRAFT_258218 [Catenaria anguillulae PL171]